jgi:hypothetical protein
MPNQVPRGAWQNVTLDFVIKTTTIQKANDGGDL